MQCPQCENLLVAVHAPGLELDQCAGCHGIWFDEAELRPFIQLVLETRDDIEFGEYDPSRLSWSVPGGDEELFPCPVCRTEMQKMNYAVDSNVIVDRCPRCHGLWVEKSEIRDLAEFLKGNPAQDKRIDAHAEFVIDGAKFRQGAADLVDALAIRVAVAVRAPSRPARAHPPAPGK